MMGEIVKGYREFVEWPPSDNYTRLGLVLLWLPKGAMGHLVFLLLVILALIRRCLRWIGV